jgi:undecaprenyl-diphosphatase
MHTLEAFNRALFLVINGTSDTPAWIVDTAVFCANYLVWLVPALLAGMWLSGRRQYRRLAIRAFVVTVAALGCNQLVGFAWPHPRPFVVGLGHTFLPHAPDSSFPSDHATVFASVALTLLVGRLRWLGGMTLVTGAVVAWARVFAGVHFPLDMAGAVGIACIAYALVAPPWSACGSMLTRLAVTIYRKLLAWPIRRNWLRA